MQYTTKKKKVEKDNDREHKRSINLLESLNDIQVGNSGMSSGV